MTQLTQPDSADLSQYFTVISIFQRFDQVGFHDRLLRWCQATGFDLQPEWSTHEVLERLDDERVQKLGLVLRKTFAAEVRQMAKQQTEAAQ